MFSPACSVMAVHLCTAVRVDWRLFNRTRNDDRLLDTRLVYGQPLPVCNALDGKEICSEEERAVVPNYPPHNRPRLITLLIREHDGLEADSPFTVSPQQLVSIL